MTTQTDDSPPLAEGSEPEPYRELPQVAAHGAKPTRARRRLGRLGVVLMAAGALTLIWATVVWRWEDPFTALYTMYEQHELAHAYDERVSRFRITTLPPPVKRAPPTKTAKKQVIPPRSALESREIALLARQYRRDSKEGEALGKIVVPRLGLNMVFLNGTDESSLEKGPGRDLQTFMPGENRLVYIAGHRTTFLAPFSDINELRAGDSVTLELPYATFVYSVTHHIIVPNNDLAVLRSGNTELLALQACHPRFFATHRYIVYARLTKVIPNAAIGPPYTPKAKPVRESRSRASS